VKTNSKNNGNIKNEVIRKSQMKRVNSDVDKASTLFDQIMKKLEDDQLIQSESEDDSDYEEEEEEEDSGYEEEEDDDDDDDEEDDDEEDDVEEDDDEEDDDEEAEVLFNRKKIGTRSRSKNGRSGITNVPFKLKIPFSKFTPEIIEYTQLIPKIVDSMNNIKPGADIKEFCNLDRKHQ